MCDSNSSLLDASAAPSTPVQHEASFSPTAVSATSTQVLRRTPVRSHMPVSTLSSPSWSTPSTVARPKGGMRGVGGNYERTQADTSEDLQKTLLALDKARLALETSKIRVKKLIDKYSHSRDDIAAGKTHAFKLCTTNKLRSKQHGTMLQQLRDTGKTLGCIRGA